jgi:hypothetical protein
VVVRQIADRGAEVAGRGRETVRGWDNAAFDATQLYQADSSNAVRTYTQGLVFILP